jgi:hypothetical protein
MLLDFPYLFTLNFISADEGSIANGRGSSTSPKKSVERYEKMAMPAQVVNEKI